MQTSDKQAKLGDLMLAKALEGSQAKNLTRPGELLGEGLEKFHVFTVAALLREARREPAASPTWRRLQFLFHCLTRRAIQIFADPIENPIHKTA